MKAVCLHDKRVIEPCLRRSPELHIYSLGDLDDFFWRHTTWFALDEKEPEAVALLYTGFALPTLLGLSERPAGMKELLQSIVHVLPFEFYAHLSPGLERVFEETHDIDPHGAHHKMALLNPAKVQEFDCSEVIQLERSDLRDLLELYADAYPQCWFDERMLETNHYFGVREREKLVSVAGVHVFSQQYGVAALGNLATHPSFRGRGYNTLATARLCQSLMLKVEHIGLNVKIGNDLAMSLYNRLGFEVIASYGEFAMRRKL